MFGDGVTLSLSVCLSLSFSLSLWWTSQFASTVNILNQNTIQPIDYLRHTFTPHPIAACRRFDVVVTNLSLRVCHDLHSV